LANTAQARKRARQNDERRLHNAGRRSMMRTHIKKVLKAIEAKDADGAKAAFRDASSVIDRICKTGLIHKNAASRYKSRLNARVRSLTA
jgi:small subunit ribosomal protein S20